MEDYIKDSIIAESGDPILNIIIDLTLSAEQDQRPLFSDPIREPYFYSRYVRRWILEGIKERAAVGDANKRLVEALTK
jgi:hypothetical protein